MNYKITVNTSPENSFNVTDWNIVGEAERVSVKRGDQEFSLVFADEGFRLEIWKLDEKGELKELYSTLYPLGVNGNPNIFQ